MLEEFIPVLMTTDLDLKIMVGEAMALIYESAREHSEEFRWKKQGLLFEKFNGNKIKMSQGLVFIQL